MQSGRLAPSGRFGRCHRLRTRGDFDRVFRNGRRARGRHLAIVGLRHGGDGSRLGLAVGKKSGNAPARARLRRLLREAFRSVRHEFPQPMELVVRTLKPWPEADLALVHAELAALVVSLERRRDRRSKP
ncbi:MAG: ribonuclease P protein component [Myxococcales bacterium]|nr:ribonuclease P protein component [Myxococcales bacterium]